MKIGFDNWVAIGFIFTLVFLGITLLINTSKSCDINIDYKPTFEGNINTSFTILPEIKLACFELCMKEIRDYNQQKLCFEKCEGD